MKTRDDDFDLPPALAPMPVLWRVNHAVERVSLRMEKELGVSGPQRLMLRVVGRHPGVTPGRLAEALHIDPGTVSATLARLERKRLVERRRDAADRRHVVVALT